MEYGSHKNSGKTANPQGTHQKSHPSSAISTSNAGRKYPAGYEKRGPSPKKMGAPHDAPNQRKD